MLQREVFPKYRGYVEELNKVYNTMKGYFSPTSFEDLCRDRGYPIGESCQYDLIKSMNIGFFETNDNDIFKDYSTELGLYSQKGSLLLNGRYIIPVESVSGDLVSLIGYYPDIKKYITLSTPFFSKECMFFNFKQAYELSYKEFDGFVIVVEGIFDCLSLRAVGLPCIATMGASVSRTKGELLKLFKFVLGIPDDDATGRKSLNRYDRSGWKVPTNTVMLKFSGGNVSIGGQLIHCKDMDNFVTWYEAEDVKETLLQFRNCREEIEELKLCV
jgi:DNA primase